MDNESFTVLPRRITFGEWEQIDEDIIGAPYYVNNHYSGQVERGEDENGSFAYVLDGACRGIPMVQDLIELTQYL